MINKKRKVIVRLGPHAKSSTYCRGSVRKYLRSVFSFDDYEYVDRIFGSGL